MTELELNTAIFKDMDILLGSSTPSRIEVSYMEHRKKIKIEKEARYPSFSAIKSKAKNQWILITEKNHELVSVKSVKDVSTLYLTYYHTHKGIRVFVPCVDKTLLVYNGHVFTRFRERMKILNNDPMTIIKQFFSNNCTGLRKTFDKKENGDIPFLTFEKDGYLMGDIQKFPGNITWHINKTFIPNDTATFKHLEPTLTLKLVSAKELLKLKSGLINELEPSVKECCHLFGLMGKEMTIDYLEQFIQEMEDPKSKG